MMILFAIPLKSRQISENWLTVCHLLERTLRSILAQTHSNYQIVVVGHECPEIYKDLAFAPAEETEAKLRFISVDFPPPTAGFYTRTDLRLDKTRKLEIAFDLAQKEKFDYVMIVDADDCLHRNLLRHLNKNPSPTGWYIQVGYIHEETRPWLIYKRSKAFNHRCGSTVIIPPQYFHNSFLDEHGLFRHTYETLSDGRPMQPVNFPGVVYTTCHGDNLLANVETAQKLKQFLLVKGWLSYGRDLAKWQWLSAKKRRDFMLYSLNSLTSVTHGADTQLQSKGIQNLLDTFKSN